MEKIEISSNESSIEIWDFDQNFPPWFLQEFQEFIADTSNRLKPRLIVKEMLYDWQKNEPKKVPHYFQ